MPICIILSKIDQYLDLPHRLRSFPVMPIVVVVVVVYIRTSAIDTQAWNNRIGAKVIDL